MLRPAVCVLGDLLTTPIHELIWCPHDDEALCTLVQRQVSRKCFCVLSLKCTKRGVVKQQIDLNALAK